MFDHTKSALKSTVKQIKFIANLFKYSTSAILIAYFIYTIFAKIGLIWANACLLALALFSLVFEIITDRSKSISKSTEKTVKRSVKFIKLFIRALTLGTMLFSIYMSAKNVNGITIIVTTLAVISWILSFLFEVVHIILEKKVKALVNSFKEDFNHLTHPFHAKEKVKDKENDTTTPNGYERESEHNTPKGYGRETFYQGQSESKKRAFSSFSDKLHGFTDSVVKKAGQKFGRKHDGNNDKDNFN